MDIELLEHFLQSFQDMLFIIEDKDGNVIYPRDHDLYEYEENFVRIRDDRYFSPLSNLWYKYDCISIMDGQYTVKRFLDITSYVKKEDLYDLDPVTGIYLRRKLLEEFKSYLEYAKANQEEFTVCIGDLDKFKRVNDTYGHLAGDEVLRSTAQKLSTSTRHFDAPLNTSNGNRRTHINRHRRDVVGRYGGEEFLMIIKNIGPDVALKRLEDIREFIAKTPVFYRYPNDGVQVEIPITISFGAVHINPEYLAKMSFIEEHFDLSAKSLIESADENLYKAKKLRNMTEFSILR